MEGKRQFIKVLGKGSERFMIPRESRMLVLGWNLEETKHGVLDDFRALIYGINGIIQADSFRYHVISESFL